MSTAVISKENAVMMKFGAQQQFGKNVQGCHDDKSHSTPSIISQRQGIVA